MVLDISSDVLIDRYGWHENNEKGLTVNARYTHHTADCRQTQGLVINASFQKLELGNTHKQTNKPKLPNAISPSFAVDKRSYKIQYQILVPL